AVNNLDQALKSGSPTAHSDGPDNVAWDVTLGGGDVDGAFQEAEVVVKERILQQRLAHIPIETRGVIAQFVPFANQLNVWSSTQIPHFLRLFIAGAMGMRRRRCEWFPRTSAARSALRSTPTPRSTSRRPYRRFRAGR